jgi:hypothetical protein
VAHLTVGGARGGDLRHLLNRHGPSTGLDNTPQSRRGKLWQEDHAAVRMYEEFDPVPGFQLEMISDCLRDRCLALAGDRGFHAAPITYLEE